VLFLPEVQALGKPERVVEEIEEQETIGMIIAGIVVTLLGFLISVASLGATSSTTVRLGMVVVGIAISLVGIIGVLNREYMSKAIWRK
jgi:hypothetical protein